MNLALFTAALLQAGVALIHLILGGREIVTPLLASEGLRGVPKYTLYFCWHIVTIVLFAMALAFGLAAQPGGSRALALFAATGASLFALLCLGINLRFARPAFAHPQALVFTPVALAGWWGLYC